MDPFYTHPSKCSQEEIVQQASNKRTEPLKHIENKQVLIFQYYLIWSAFFKSLLYFSTWHINDVWGVNLMCDLVNPDEEDELGHEEAAAQVLVDRGSGVLDVSEEPEGEDTHGQADDGDHHAQLRYSCQNIIVCKQLHKTEQEH